jgi:hypothetical protein
MFLQVLPELVVIHVAGQCVGRVLLKESGVEIWDLHGISGYPHLTARRDLVEGSVKQDQLPVRPIISAQPEIALCPGLFDGEVAIKGLVDQGRPKRIMIKLVRAPGGAVRGRGLFGRRALDATGGQANGNDGSGKKDMTISHGIKYTNSMDQGIAGSKDRMTTLIKSKPDLEVTAGGGGTKEGSGPAFWVETDPAIQHPGATLASGTGVDAYRSGCALDKIAETGILCWIGNGRLF